MADPTYRTIVSPAKGEFKDKGSRFFAFAYPVVSVESVKEHIVLLRQEHNKARHWCYAYRIGTEGNEYRANDDGEPSGSAGRPILGQIDSFGVTDVLVVVVRYFGGTLLGVPGLINAYKMAAMNALNQAEIIQKDVQKDAWISCAYPQLSEVIRIIRHYNAEIVSQKLALDCRLAVRIPVAVYDECVAKWKEIHTVNLETPP